MLEELFVAVVTEHEVCGIHLGIVIPYSTRFCSDIFETYQMRLSLCSPRFHARMFGATKLEHPKR